LQSEDDFHLCTLTAQSVRVMSSIIKISQTECTGVNRS